MFFTNKGRVYRMKAYEIPEASRTARGTAIVNLLQLQPEERISAVISLKEYNDTQYLMMATKSGIVKKTKLNEYANIRKTGIQAITLRDDDELIEVKRTEGDSEVLLVSKNGMCIRFREQDVRSTGRSSMGVIGMNLVDDEVVAMQLVSQGKYMLFVSENGLGKLTEIDEFTNQYRGGKGVKCYKIMEKSGCLVGAKALDEDREIMIITTEGILIRMPVSGISILGRNTTGVKLINLDASKDIKVASIAKVRDTGNVTDETAEGEETIETAAEETESAEE